MHEVGLMAEALRRAVETAEQAGAKRIERLTFAIVPGGHVSIESVHTLFETMSVGTIAEGAALDVEQQAVERFCLSCQKLVQTVDAVECPECGGLAAPRSDALELALVSIDVAE